MKKILGITVLFLLLFLMACSKQTGDVQKKALEKWAEQCVVEDYAPNEEITGEYDETLAATCENGVFVGLMQEDVRLWKGIPFAAQPVGELRFRQAQDPAPSDKVYGAYHFGHSAMQATSEEEMASLYPQGEDCLNLNIWSSAKNTAKDKPVLVFIYGGGWKAGGTSDPTYNGFRFARDNPDILLVTIAYRVGMFGMINLSSFPDGEDYPTAINNGILDQVQALRWINRNIKAFGGNPENITIIGESAGGGSVSTLCTLPQAKGLFQKAINMSGGVNQGTTYEESDCIAPALVEEFGVRSVADIQNLSFEELRAFWGKKGEEVHNLQVLDGTILSKDPYSLWEKGETKDITILQGHTSNEFKYFQLEFFGLKAIYDMVCGTVVEAMEERSDDVAKQDIKAYLALMCSKGHSKKEANSELMNDFVFSATSLYQADCHAKNGGRGYFYIFDKAYDYPEYLGASHAVDCYYLFGNFDGIMTLGTEEEVAFSRAYQQKIVNFCKTGDPSTEEEPWPVYDRETRKTMIIGDDTHVEENPDRERTELLLKMVKENPVFRYTGSFAAMYQVIGEKHPLLIKLYMKILASQQEE